MVRPIWLDAHRGTRRPLSANCADRDLMGIRPRWIRLVPVVGVLLLLLQGNDWPPPAARDVLGALQDLVLRALQTHEDLETACIVTVGTLLAATLLLVLSQLLTFV
jgi:hypothetical protein